MCLLIGLLTCKYIFIPNVFPVRWSQFTRLVNLIDNKQIFVVMVTTSVSPRALLPILRQYKRNKQIILDFKRCGLGLHCTGRFLHLVFQGKSPGWLCVFASDPIYISGVNVNLCFIMFLLFYFVFCLCLCLCFSDVKLYVFNIWDL